MGKQWKQWQTIFCSSKITADGDCSHEIKRCILLGRKVMTNLDNILRSKRHYLANKGPSSQCCGFSSSHVWMWENIKKAEHRRTDVFEPWYWRRLLRAPWTARRCNQSILNEISLICWSWNYNPLATWCKELTDCKRSWCWERLKAGGEGDDRGWDDWMASLYIWAWVWVNSRSWWWTGKPGMLQSMGSQRAGHDWATELNWIKFVISFLPRSKHHLISWL